MDAGALGTTAKRHAGKGIAIAAAGVAAAAIFTASASATSSGGTTTLRLTAKATARVFITPCRTCVTSVPAGIHTGVVADEYGVLVNARDTRVGHFRLLNHPDIYREIKARVSARSALVPGPAAREGRYARAATALRARIRSRRRSPSP